MPHFALALIGLVGVGDATSNSDVVWQWDRDTLACVLQQETSQPGEKIEIRRTPGVEATALRLIIPTHSEFRSVHSAPGEIALNPGGKIVAEVYQQPDPDKGYPYIATGTEDRTFMQRLSQANAVEISGPGIGPVKVTLKSAGAAVMALGQCEDRRMREWGMDPALLHSLRISPKPVKPLTERITALDYPHAAIAYSVQGDVFIRLDVAADGRVTSCKALNAAQYRGFEYAACDELRGARFRPAIDADGHAVSAPYIFEIKFQLR